MNIFKVHSGIIDEYKSYIRSFINIKNQTIKEKVEQDLASGKLWPEPLIQFNPSFKPGDSVAELVSKEVLHDDMNAVFAGFLLYEHQVQAVTLGSKNENFIVTSGTGSGKSLTYIGTIFNHLLKEPKTKGIKSIIIYPMNALINSQYEELRKYEINYLENKSGLKINRDGKTLDEIIKELHSRTNERFPITYAQYTGQENDEIRKNILRDLPDIILTNYMMLELMLTRVGEKEMRESIYQSLKYLVFDEMHTYRGRQGSDVALLIRRLKSKCVNELSCIGTSATMVSGGSIQDQKNKVAEVANIFFGTSFKTENIIMETLISSLGDSASEVTSLEVKSAIKAGSIEITAPFEELLKNPIAKWLEQKIALGKSEDEVVVRNKPQTLESIITQFAEFTEIPQVESRTYILDLLEWISITNVWANKNNKKTILPFKLHQFIGQTGSVYITLDADDTAKLITLEAGVYAPKEEGEIRKKPIYPIVFSRESGHEFICVTKNTEKKKFEPREFSDWTVSEEEEIEGSAAGYLIVGEDIWSEDDKSNLPDGWVNTDANGNVTGIVKKYRERVPKKIYFNEYGEFSEDVPKDTSLNQEGWFMPYKLLFDPTSGTFYDPKTSEGTKLTKLGSEGRSTSTTILSFNILRKLSESGYSSKQQKVLSFTDNRQDAALQAGHFNDFIDTVHLRTGINFALKNSSKSYLEFNEIGQAVFNALGLEQQEFATSPAEFAGGKRENEDALKDYLIYRVLHDLRRSWRVILPNLEQCGLLMIKYKGLEEDVADPAFISSHRLIEKLDHNERIEFIYTTLDFFRKSYAIRSQEYLTDSAIDIKRRTIIQKLKQPWRFDDDEKITRPYFMRYDAVPKNFEGFTASIGHLSGYGKYLRKLFKDKLDETLKESDYLDQIELLLNIIEKGGWLFSMGVPNSKGKNTKLYQLNVEKILWTSSDENYIKSDPIKTRSYKSTLNPANEFFKSVYQVDFKSMKRLNAADHTGQIGNEDRKSREEKFREGTLSAMFCSPTMELGIDISSLDVVHMRNVPPNPANYAQRSGRAGRSGQAALVFTYCSAYSPHDKNYFKNAIEMVSGTVAAPKLDLANEEMLKTHLNSLFLAELGIKEVNQSIAELVEESDVENQPLKQVVSEKIKNASTDNLKNSLEQTFRKVISDFRKDKLEGGNAKWFTDDWIRRNIESFSRDFDKSLNRWRKLYKSAHMQLVEATKIVLSEIYTINSREYKDAIKNITQAKRQIAILKNDRGLKSLSEFYPYRYFASEGFLPGYNFTRLPIRTYLQNNEVGEYVSRPRFVALREFGPKNIIYHNGTKFSIEQLVLREKLNTQEAKVCIQSGYFLSGSDYASDTCPLTNTPLDSDKSRKVFVNLVEMAETRGVQKDRISCDEEERASQGFNIETYFSIPAGIDTVRKARVLSGTEHLLNLQYIPSAKLIQINSGWRKTREEGFRVGTESGFWRSHSYEIKPDSTDEIKKIQLFTWDNADALYIQPIVSLGLDYDGIITLMYALKRAIEIEFQVEPSEIGVAQMGDEENPNIFIYENAEGSLGILSQIVNDTETFNKLIKIAYETCRFNDDDYTAPASYDDLLSYYNQRHHLIIDRNLIKDKLNVLQGSHVELLTQNNFDDYDDHYKSLLRQIDGNSETERRFLDYLYKNNLRLPDSAQEKHGDIYVMPDFKYEPDTWIFCDGTPHDKPEIKEKDKKQREAIVNNGEFYWVYYYKDDLDKKIQQRSDIFKKVR
jgi:superfamily II DNA/RNA helicase